MTIVTPIMDALRNFGSPTQKTAIQRQDEQLQGKCVVDRRLHVARSELGQTPAFVATVEKVSETVVPLTDVDLTPIHENASLGDAFIAAFAGHGLGAEFLDNLDNAFGAWVEATEKQGYSNDAVVAIAGAAFGRYCAEKLDMRWVLVTDEYGAAIAIQGRTKDFRGFPYDAISKRISVGEYGFFKPIYITLQDTAGFDGGQSNAA